MKREGREKRVVGWDIARYADEKANLKTLEAKRRKGKKSQWRAKNRIKTKTNMESTESKPQSPAPLQVPSLNWKKAKSQSTMNHPTELHDLLAEKQEERRGISLY